jgi:RNA polymerase sigma factor (TIGR02999 family)
LVRLRNAWFTRTNSDETREIAGLPMNDRSPSGGEDPSGQPLARSTAELFPVVYEELRGLAALYFRDEQPGHTLQPTALVHETYLRLAADGARPWRSRDEFVAIAASAMRRVLVDHARKRGAIKRGGGARPLSIDVRASNCGLFAARANDVDFATLDDALCRLNDLEPRQARLVELRVFGGMTTEAAAHVIDVAPSTAYKDWEMAKAWLLRELGG